MELYEILQKHKITNRDLKRAIYPIPCECGGGLRYTRTRGWISFSLVCQSCKQKRSIGGGMGFIFFYWLLEELYKNKTCACEAEKILDDFFEKG